MRRLRTAAFALMAAGLLSASLAARAADAVAPNDPVLIESMTDLCLRAAMEFCRIRHSRSFRLSSSSTTLSHEK